MHIMELFTLNIFNLCSVGNVDTKVKKFYFHVSISRILYYDYSYKYSCVLNFFLSLWITNNILLENLIL